MKTTLGRMMKAGPGVVAVDPATVHNPLHLVQEVIVETVVMILLAMKADAATEDKQKIPESNKEITMHIHQMTNSKWHRKVHLYLEVIGTKNHHSPKEE